VTDLFVPVVAERPSLRRRRVVFAAAFARAENREAARWLTDRVWPQVRAQVPDGELYLVGNGPPGWATGRDDRSIHVTGRVPVLAPFYLDAGIACAPLRRGAGVKMKVLEGMAYGLPVVTTRVGAEGIVGDPHHPPPLVIADTPARFADALIQLLQDRAARVALGWAGQRWVEGRYDSRRSITTIVNDMQRACGPATGTADEIRACR
jgi:glycosyltransferase involved in cell wall biosynthesis